MRCHVLFVAVLLTAACQAPYTIERAEQPSSVFIEEYMKTKGITEATHGSPHDIAFFTTADTPTAIPDRSTVWHGSGLKLVVAHSLGYSTVEPLYELNAHRRYSQNGRGPDIPIAVRVNPPSHYSAKLTRSSYRQLELDQEYKLTNPFLYNDHRLKP